MNFQWTRGEAVLSKDRSTEYQRQHEEGERKKRSHLREKLERVGFLAPRSLLLTLQFCPRPEKETEWDPLLLQNPKPAASQARRRLALTCQTRLEGVLKFSGGLLNVDEVVLPG